MLNEPPTAGWSEDWTAAVVGGVVMALVVLACYGARPRDVDWSQLQKRSTEIRRQDASFSAQQESALSESEKKLLAKSRNKSSLEKLGVTWSVPISPWLAKLESWTSDPADAFRRRDEAGQPASAVQWANLVTTGVMLLAIGCVAVCLRRGPLASYLIAFPALFILSVAAFLLAAQSVVKYYNFEYPLWGLFVGMLICNTVGLPGWLKPAVLGELYIKIGLVLLGGEVLLPRLLALGLPGICVAWVVTPIVLISTYQFGQKVLKIESRTLNMVVSADMSVCGVSAAIATAAACKAKKEELSLAIGISLAFTALMMVVMPLAIHWMQLDPRVGGAWIGGTIDSTGAVVAAGEALGILGAETAVTVKMIQNILIGVVALAVAAYWSRWVEPGQSDQAVRSKSMPTGIGVIWRRFPKFVLGFLAVSLVASAIFQHSFFGESLIHLATTKCSSQLRSWLFCVAFVAIGLSTNFRELAPYLRSGKPLVLYVCGQALNLLLTFLMAYLMFGIVFRETP